MVDMTEVETGQRGGTPHWENGTNINNIMDEQEDMEDDLESNSAKLFERSRIKALAGLQIALSLECKEDGLVMPWFDSWDLLRFPKK